MPFLRKIGTPRPYLWGCLPRPVNPGSSTDYDYFSADSMCINGTRLLLNIQNIKFKLWIPFKILFVILVRITQHFFKRSPAAFGLVWCFPIYLDSMHDSFCCLFLLFVCCLFSLSLFFFFFFFLFFFPETVEKIWNAVMTAQTGQFAILFAGERVSEASPRYILTPVQN